MELEAHKKTIREQLLLKRRQLTAAEINQQSLQCFNQLRQVLDKLSYDSIMLYHPIQNEINPLMMIEYFWQAGKRIYLPVVRDPVLLPSEFNPTSELRPGSFQIKEPHPQLLTDPGKIDVVIVPCVGCDRQHQRIGYGKGYYDRFLTPDHLAIGICYPFQIVDQLPVAEHDKPLQKIVSSEEAF